MIENFLKILEAQGWKQREIASKSGLSRNYISGLAHGANCSVDTLLKLSSAFCVSTDFILGIHTGRTTTPLEEELLTITNGNDQITIAALRAAQGERALLQEGTNLPKRRAPRKAA